MRPGVRAAAEERRFAGGGARERDVERRVEREGEGAERRPGILEGDGGRGGVGYRREQEASSKNRGKLAGGREKGRGLPSCMFHEIGHVFVWELCSILPNVVAIFAYPAGFFVLFFKNR